MWPNSYSACPIGCRVAGGYVRASHGLGAAEKANRVPPAARAAAIPRGGVGFDHAPAWARHHVDAGGLAEPAAGAGGQPLAMLAQN
jgi:hypothetical protein